MARKAGQIIARGPRTWLVRVSIGRNKQSNTRQYHNKTIHGSMWDAHIYLSRKLEERQIGQLAQAAAMHLSDFQDRWLTTVARPRLRPRTYDGYESSLRLYIRPILGTRAVGSASRKERLCIRRM
ncbi:MAG: hypothetical protein WCC87_07275 [Candidatus Korobacteraceae bacterium]